MKYLKVNKDNYIHLTLCIIFCICNFIKLSLLQWVRRKPKGWQVHCIKWYSLSSDLLFYLIPLVAKTAIKNQEIWVTLLFDLWKSALALLWPRSQREDTDEKYTGCALWIRFLSRVKKVLVYHLGFLLFY